MFRLAAIALVLWTWPAAAQTQGGNPPPTPPSRPATLSDHVLSSPEIQLALIVLAFGVLLIVLQAVVVLKARFDDETTVRLLTLTLVVIATLFTVTAGFAREDIAPVIGLFGTIIGYLLGRQTRGSTVAGGSQ